MSRCVDFIYRVTRAIRIRIQPTLTKRTQTVRAVKPHQHRIKRSIAITQQIVPGQWVRPFAIEPHQTHPSICRLAVTIGRIGDGLCLVVGFESVEHRALLINRQQRGVVFDTLLLLLRQQPVTVLEEGLAQRSLNFRGSRLLQ